VVTANADFAGRFSLPTTSNSDFGQNQQAAASRRRGINLDYACTTIPVSARFLRIFHRWRERFLTKIAVPCSLDLQKEPPNGSPDTHSGRCVLPLVTWAHEEAVSSIYACRRLAGDLHVDLSLLHASNNNSSLGAYFLLVVYSRLVYSKIQFTGYPFGSHSDLIRTARQQTDNQQQATRERVERAKELLAAGCSSEKENQFCQYFLSPFGVVHVRRDTKVGLGKGREERAISRVCIGSGTAHSTVYRKVMLRWRNLWLCSLLSTCSSLLLTSARRPADWRLAMSGDVRVEVTSDFACPWWETFRCWLVVCIYLCGDRL